MPPGIYDHIIYEVEGDIADLATVKSSDLIDKKVVKRASEATLILTQEMSIAEELIEYLSYVLELPDDKIPEIIKVFHDYAKNIEMG
jgi:hypothetical protein